VNHPAGHHTVLYRAVSSSSLAARHPRGGSDQKMSFNANWICRENVDVA